MRVNRIFALSLMLFLASCDSTSVELAVDTDNKDGNLATPAETTTPGSLDKTDEMAKIAYAMGANSGYFLARNLPEFESWGMQFDPEVIKKGFLESLDQKSQMEEQEIQTVLTAFQEQIKVKLAEIEEQQAKVTAEANKLFLDANLLKEGVKVTESGIQYRIIEAGTGATPTATDNVKAHYRGSLVSGQEFDSSYARDKPEEFSLNGVIPGWTEGLQLIKEGGKIEMVLPPELAYGDRALPQIPANSVLVFEVELLEIVKQVQAETK